LQNILRSKLQIPIPSGSLVHRPRLYLRLNEGLHKKLILLSAPAGFGKTSLLSSWLRQTEMNFAWLSLDKEDNDPVRFLRYLAAVFQESDPTLDNTVADLLGSPQPQLKNAALTALLNQIDGLTGESIVVLDDFHLIDNPQIHQAVDYLISYLPSSLHLVISSRADPALTLSRMRGHGDILDIRMADLRFTVQEAREYFARLEGPHISDQNVNQLIKKTEGWVSGLQMANLSLRGIQDREAFVDSFSGSNRYILDYLLEEVLEQQSQERQEFLLYTALFNRLTGRLCDAVLERSGSQQVLEDLERENLFLVPLDEHRSWYRYHQLFKDLLRHKLDSLAPEKIAELYDRASGWYIENGWAEQAIDCSLKSGQVEQAARLIGENGAATLMRSEVSIVQSWLDHLPAEQIHSDPRLAFLNAWAMIIKGESINQALALIDQIAGTDPDQTGRILALKAFCLITQGEFQQAGYVAKQALESLPDGDIYFRGLSAWIYGINSALQKDVSNSVMVLESLAATDDFQHSPFFRVTVFSQIARAYFHLGDFKQSQSYFEQALACGKDRQGNWIPIAGEALMGLGDLLREQNQLDLAGDCILDGIELTRQWRPAASMEGYLFLARVKQLQKDWSSANQALDKALELAIAFDELEIDDRIVAMWQARLWTFEGIVDKVDHWVQNTGVLPLREGLEWDRSEDFNIDRYLMLREKMVLARYFLLIDKFSEALDLTSRLEDLFEEYGRLDFLIEIYLIQTVANDRQGNGDQAFQALEKSLELGEKGRFLGLFLEMGDDLQDLLLKYKGQRRNTAYFETLLESLPAPELPHPQTGELLLDPLSERELEVLQALPSNLTTPELAEQLVVSVNTVRTHIKNIYQKLDVHKRSEAVRKARFLKLI